MSNSNISKYSDHTVKCRLIDKDDIDILRSVAMVSAFVENSNRRISEIQQQMEQEKNRKYPDASFIARCEKKIGEIRQNIALYNLQRQK